MSFVLLLKYLQSVKHSTTLTGLQKNSLATKILKNPPSCRVCSLLLGSCLPSSTDFSPNKRQAAHSPTQMSRLVVRYPYGWELAKWSNEYILEQSIYIFYKYLLSKSSEYCRFFMVSSDKAAHTNVLPVPHGLALMLFNPDCLAQHSDIYHQDWSVI